MVDRFSAITARRSMIFEAWFNERKTPDRSWAVDESAWAFESRYLPRRTVRGRKIPTVDRALREFRPDVLVSLHSGIEYFLGWQTARSRGVRTAFRILPPSPVWFGQRRHKEAVKRYMFKRVDGLLVSGPDAATYVQGLGADPDRIFEHPQVVDVSRFSTGSRGGRPTGYETRGLDLRGVVFVCVGRLWWGKGVDVLVDAAHLLSDRGVPFSLLIVGDGPDEAALRERASGLGTAVRFMGFNEGDELLALLDASDVFVFPTLGDPYGLVVDEAMASGLPVISTDAAGEIRTRVADGVTGTIVRAGDAMALADAMESIAEDSAGRERMGQAAAAAMAGRTPEYFAATFDAAVAGILGARKR
jgi:glycosyltransferase involved in cell wall biosynthesis